MPNSSMKAIIASVSGHVPPAQNKRLSIVLEPAADKGRALAKDFMDRAQFMVLSFQHSYAITFFGCHAIPLAVVLLGLRDPVAPACVL